MTEPTNIADAITAAQGRVADCYTSVETMGGTIPATQNLTNLPAAIESIPTGGGGGGDTIYLTNESGGTITTGDKVLFTLGSIDSNIPPNLYNCIVANSQANYDTNASYTGFATGQTDSSGRYEVSTVLPQTTTVALCFNFEPDEINLYGGAE